MVARADLGEERRQRGAVGGVDHVRVDRAVVRRRLVRQRLGRRRELAGVAPADDDVCAARREEPRHGTPDA
ncbi:MAG: hypothetical protein MUF21_13255 [Gemmatimonadaceae bacterium]|nr:hypothetical protein [Gemmatimonadaceae bacterium]